MKTLLLLAALTASNPTFAVEIYGNTSGCGPRNAATDNLIRITPTEIQEWESTCALPETVDYSGADMTLTCKGEAEEWTETIALKKEGDTLIYNGSTVLSRCPTP